MPATLIHQTIFDNREQVSVILVLDYSAYRDYEIFPFLLLSKVCFIKCLPDSRQIA